MTSPAGFGGVSGLTIATDAARRNLRGLIVLLGSVNVLLPAGLFAWAELTGGDYWDYFWGELNAITWFSSAQLLVVGGVAWANAEVAALIARLAPDGGARRRWIWRAFGLGFLFLALDERFEFHELVRDRVLKPADAFSGLGLIRPGDVGLYVYLAVGLALTVFLVAELRRDRTALLAFATGVVLAAATTVVDALPRDIERRISFFWTSIFEEGGELWSQFLFLLAFAIRLDGRIRELAAAGRGRG